MCIAMQVIEYLVDSSHVLNVAMFRCKQNDL